MGKSNGVTTSPPLFDYGIQTERSDIRVHIAPESRMAFVFQTAAAQALDLSQYRKVPAYQTGVEYATAEGYLVPPAHIGGIRCLRLFEDHWWVGFDRAKLTTKRKGQLAVDLTVRLLKLGYIPLWVHHASECTLIDVQRKGTDIVLIDRWRIQVKHDSKGGKSEFGGSGNLFLQTAELNPARQF